MNRKRFKKEEILKQDYIQMPKWLFNEEFKSLSNDGKVLYSVLMDRHRLSVANNWINEIGEVYFLFTRENMAEMLNCNIKSAIKYFKELLKFNLVEEKRQGINKPNIIFLLDVSFENQLTGKIYTSRDVKNTTQDMYNLQCNKNDFNKNDSSKNDKSYNAHDTIVTSVNNFYKTFDDLINHINTEMDNLNLKSNFNKEKEKVSRYFFKFYSNLYKKTGLKQKVLTTKQLQDSINYCLESIETGTFTDGNDCLFDDLLKTYIKETEFLTLNGFFSQYIEKVTPRINRVNEDDIA